MEYRIKCGGRLAGGAVFFTVLIGLMIHPETWEFSNFISALAKASVGGIVGWFAGNIVCDILLKGICTDVEAEDTDMLVEGGLMQRLKMMSEGLFPGGSDMPFADAAPEKKSVSRDRKK